MLSRNRKENVNPSLSLVPDRQAISWRHAGRADVRIGDQRMGGQVFKIVDDETLTQREWSENLPKNGKNLPNFGCTHVFFLANVEFS